MAEENEDSLWNTLAGFFDSDDASPREREMVMSPPPPKPVLTQEPGEDSTAFRIRRGQAERAWKKTMLDRENYPEDFMVPAAEAAPAPESGDESRYNRREQLDRAIREAGG